MKPEVTLCEHLRERPRELRIAAADILDWYDGPVTAVLRCSRCGGLGLIALLDWSPTLRVRVFALAGIEREALEVYRRNAARGSCDASRLERETAAFLSCSGPAERWLALDVRNGGVLACVATGSNQGLPEIPWSKRLPEPDDESWFSRLGLDKFAA